MQTRNRETSSITLALGNFEAKVATEKKKRKKKKNLERNAEMEEASGEDPFPMMLLRNSGKAIQN